MIKSNILRLFSDAIMSILKIYVKNVFECYNSFLVVSDQKKYVCDLNTIHLHVIRFLEDERLFYIYLKI